VSELQDAIIGSRIEKVSQPNRYEVILSIGIKGRKIDLLISADARNARIHLTDFKKTNPANPHRFCVFLRKHIYHNKIVDIQADNFERIISIALQGTNGLGDIDTKTLIIEVMGKHSNIVLINSNEIILDSIKHVDSRINRIREIMPARRYEPPPYQSKVNLDSLNSTVLINKASQSENISTVKFLVNSVKGVSTLLCNEVCYRSGVSLDNDIKSISTEDIKSLVKSMLGIKRDIESKFFTPCILYNTNHEIIDFHCIKMSHNRNSKCYQSMSRTIDEFYKEKEKQGKLQASKNEVIKVINTATAKCKTKINIYKVKLHDVENRDKLRIMGELILANIHNIPAISSKVLLTNYYHPECEQIEVKMEEKLSPKRNAQRYFKLYTKAKSTFEHVSLQYEKTLKELEYLDTILVSIENCETLDDIDEIKRELAREGYIKAASNIKNKSTNHKAFVPYHFISTQGIDIYIGKNNCQNDFLTFKMASPKDIWLHVKDMPGCHVIVKNAEKQITDATIEEAAQFAAFYSKAKYSTKAQVDYTQVKNVKKSPGSKPGMVIYNNYKTITVSPCRPH